MIEGPRPPAPPVPTYLQWIAKDRNISQRNATDHKGSQWIPMNHNRSQQIATDQWINGSMDLNRLQWIVNVGTVITGMSSTAGHHSESLGSTEFTNFSLKMVPYSVKSFTFFI